MTGPARAFPAEQAEAIPDAPRCPGRIPEDRGEARRSCGAHCERITERQVYTYDEETGANAPALKSLRVRYGALCRLCHELEYSLRWVKRSQAPEANLGSLQRERAHWEGLGHVFRFEADRTHVDRRAGPGR